MSSYLPPFKSAGTDAIHVGQEPERNASWGVVQPITMSSTFKQSEPGIPDKGFDYSRGGNPSRNSLEEALAALHGAKHGFAWSSGLGGTVSILHLLKPGDHVVAMHDLYGGTNRLFRQIGMPMGITFDFVDATDAENVARAIRPETKMVWIESPTNPLLQLADLRAIADIVEPYRARGTFMVVDNTFMSAYFQRPLSLGADVVFASCTKYLNGHSDLVMGMCVTSNEDIAKRLRFIQYAMGAIPSPFDSWLCNRGLKTLHVRMRCHQENALAVATFLEASPKTGKVIHPGLKSHPQHELAKRQTTGMSGMVSFHLRGGKPEARAFLKALKVFTLAESLGAVESLAEVPSIMTHASVSKEERERLGITDGLIRLSVGIEDKLDLLEDLRQALNVAVPGGDEGPSPQAIIDSLAGDFAALSVKSSGASTSSSTQTAHAETFSSSSQTSTTTTTTTTSSSSSSSAQKKPASPTRRHPPHTVPHPASRFDPPVAEDDGRTSVRVAQPPGGASSKFVFG